MNLWLDDIREAPEGWHHARSVMEAIDAALNNEIDQMSLDHDLGFDHYAGVVDSGTPNGYHFVMWMRETGHWPKQKPTVHSQNPDGARWMRAAIDRYFEPTV